MAAASEYDYVIVGGGIAGVTCAETLYQLHPEASVGLISASPTVKSATNLRRVTRLIEDFDVSEQSGSELEKQCPNAKVIYDVLDCLSHDERTVSLRSGRLISYKKLCLCMGGYPKLIAENCPFVLGIRDTESVQEFQARLSTARRIVLVGNGGIATELAYEIEGCSIVWVVKDKNISATFVDAGASEFFLPQMRQKKSSNDGPSKRDTFEIDDSQNKKTVIRRVLPNELNNGNPTNLPKGGALGPDWSAGLPMKGVEESRFVHVVYKSQVREFWTEEEVPEEKRLGAADTHTGVFGDAPSEKWPLFVELTNGEVCGCDLLVSATGVTPNTASFLPSETSMKLGEDGGISVNEQMRTAVEHVYAAGDCASAAWDWSPHWFQMRLWCQARQMGFQAAKAMAADLKGEPVVPADFAFELFTHVTRFFNFKVILLGKYNAQGLDDDYELLLRMTPGEEYLKCVMQNGRMQGCLLIGETDLEETFENLILNQLDLTQFGEELLNPNIDIEDYFD